MVKFKGTGGHDRVSKKARLGRKTSLKMVIDEVTGCDSSLYDFTLLNFDPEPDSPNVFSVD